MDGSTKYNQIETPTTATAEPTKASATVKIAVIITLLVVSALFVTVVTLAIVLPAVLKPKTTPHTDDKFDYIIVGAGASGCVVAARLAQKDPNAQILLIEAGGKTHASLGGDDYAVARRYDPATKTYNKKPLTRIDVPLLWTTVPWNDMLGYNWKMQDATLGKGLGGGGAVNAMIYVRGIPQDFESWHVSGWTYEDALKYYKKSEHHTGTNAANAHFHAQGGPIEISDPRYVDAAGQLFVQAAINANHKSNPDFNGESREGVGYYQFNNRDGIRDSTASALLAPALNGTHLSVFINSRVTKILFDDHDYSLATGVQFIENEDKTKVKTVYATKEVILAAGAINSPRLLLLSGIGPEADMKALGITVLKDLPGVGKNLHDHSMTWVDWYFPTAWYPNAYLVGKHLDAYAWARNGIFSWSGLSAGGFAKSKPELDRPDVQFTVFPKDLESQLEYDISAPTTPRKAAMTVTVTLDTPKTKGEIKLKSADPLDNPVLVNTLEQQFKAKTNDPADMDSLIWGIQELRRIKTFAPFNDTLGEEMSPGPAIQTRDQLEQWVRDHIKRTDHWVGSCKMGDVEKDPLAVVDANLKVKGFKNLRVADGSIMPQINHGNTHATCIMIGEKAADLISSGSTPTPSSH